MVATIATVATTAATAEVEEATARSHGAWAPLHCVVPGHAERPEQDLRMPITGGQQFEAEWFVGGRAGGWVGGQRQVARAHAIPQGGKSREPGCGVRVCKRRRILTIASIRYFFVTPAHPSTPIHPTGTWGVPGASAE